MAALMAAGTSDSAPGVPFAGAIEALIEIHESGPSWLRPTVLHFLPRVIGQERAIQYLKDVMISRDATAIWALRVLVGQSREGPQSFARAADTALRDVLERSLAADPTVAADLHLFALQKGWR
jgi:hypothetical protein